MKKGRESDEYIITRLDHVTPPKNIVNIYGQQESRTSNDDSLESCRRLHEDLLQIDDYGEAVLLIGDMNRAVGSDDLGDVDNSSKVSYGGHGCKGEKKK